MASNHYKQKRYLPAFKALSDAFQLAPNNIHIALNLLQTLAAISEMKSFEEEHTVGLQRCLSILAASTLNEEQQEKYNRYLEMLPSQEELSVKDAS
ncbi:hypothetical protein [Alteromonas sp. KUL49]|uniref:hypothetical protein n=1 Tax=Alteromonas sp. KUL49 TaxID=2480798 RepID=UPI00102F1033|nr:hypothetical protein [Alteromonas sp. KUL49]TAP41618.1 hypothetical protein EYS00_05425 [Alteromonas sp. KUL49]GEA10720.1 hypothetical protein KUL49_10950 [Alteromonas sp. KUL49]